MAKRVSTGIKGLNGLLDGGFLERSLVLLAGGPGSGKTIFSGTFLYKGLEEEESSTYVTFTETREKLLREFDELGMDFSTYERRNTFKVLDMTVGEEMEMEDAASEIMDAARNVEADRLVIDSLSSMVSGLESDQKKRRYVRVIYRVLERLGCTSIAISEIPTLGKGTNYGFEEFLADGVIVLRSEYEENELKRRMEILKMRGSDHSREAQRYHITDDGFELTRFRV